ncbi:MAG: helix-turn-helix domain-containing protein [Eubacteriales bacterium]
MRSNEEEKLPNWILRFADGDEAKAEKFKERLKEYYYLEDPLTESQDHYLVKDAAKTLELSPVTLRQYIRENKIFARKIKRQWYIPIDAILRYTYAEENEHQPDSDVPMGVIQFKKEDEDKEFTFENYKIVSDKELRHILEQNLSEEDLYSYFDVDRGRYVMGELFAANAYSFSENKPHDYINEDLYEFPSKTKVQLQEIAKKDNWRKMPISLMKAKYKQIFNKTPDLDDVRLFRSTIEDIEWNENKFYLEDALLAKLTEEICTTNMITYAFNRMALGVIPESLLNRADYILDIFIEKGFLDPLAYTWKGPNRNTEYNEYIGYLFHDASYLRKTNHPAPDFDRQNEYDVDELLEEMIELANSPEFKVYEEEYENK